MSDTEGRLQTITQLVVPIKEMQAWSPERITAFFDGIAQAIRASQQSACRWKRPFTMEHFAVARGWSDAAKMLEWAFDTGSTVQEMRAYRRACRGDDLSEEEEQGTNP